MSYGILAQLNVKTLEQAVERIRAMAGAMRVDHPITIVSPKDKVWRIPRNTDIEVKNVVEVIEGNEGLDAEWLDEGFDD
jgi:hypothetical protein